LTPGGGEWRVKRRQEEMLDGARGVKRAKRLAVFWLSSKGKRPDVEWKPISVR
jgi:hypothetical protein